MSKTMLPYVLLALGGVLISSISQVMLKKSAGKQYESLLAEYLNPLVFFAYVLFVAAGNTCGQGASDLYTGRFALDQSTLDRFAQIAFDYDPQIEESLTSNNVELLDFVRVLREASQAVGVRAVFSYRCLTMAAKLQVAYHY